MSSPWGVGLVFAGGTAVAFWGLWVWADFLLWRQRRRGIEPSRAQVEVREWPAATTLGFTLLASAVWLAV